MRKFWKILKRVVFTAALVLIISAGAGVAYIHSLDLDAQPAANPATTVESLTFLKHAVAPPRGRILAIVTSTAKAAGGRVSAGFELTELSRAYYTFRANGFEVDIASPKGGKPPVRLDDELVDADYAFLNDTEAQRLLANSLPLASVDPETYASVYFVGGKGAMFDFPGNPDVHRIIRSIYANGGVIGAVCHGPMALVGVHLPGGRRLLDGRHVTGFTNEEELFLIADARAVFPVLLQDALMLEGASFAVEASSLAAVTTPVEYAGAGDRFGDVAPPRIADLVVLTRNPLADIRNTQAIELVLFTGRLYDAPAIERIKRQVLSNARSWSVGSKMIWRFLWNPANY